MNNEEIKEFIANEVRRQMKIEKEKLANKVRNKLLYTGEFAGARKLIDVFHDWWCS